MKTLKYLEGKKEFNVFVASTFYDLALYRKENKKAAFNALLQSGLYQVKRYITKRLTTTLSKGNLPQGKYKADDFIDQLFIEAYNHFDEVTNEKELHPWLFKKADELLEDAINEEEFNDFFFKNIDDFSKPEWDEMEENYSTDAGGDFVMTEDLDDISYPKNDYTLNHVFVEDNKQEMMDKIDRDLSQEEIRKHLEVVLYNLPTPMSVVFELVTEYQFTLSEVATIRDESYEEVQRLFEAARLSLQKSFLSRYAADA